MTDKKWKTTYIYVKLSAEESNDEFKKTVMILIYFVMIGTYTF